MSGMSIPMLNAVVTITTHKVLLVCENIAITLDFIVSVDALVYIVITRYLSKSGYPAGIVEFFPNWCKVCW